MRLGLHAARQDTLEPLFSVSSVLLGFQRRLEPCSLKKSIDMAHMAVTRNLSTQSN
jgi:hypothetical protein